MGLFDFFKKKKTETGNVKRAQKGKVTVKPVATKTTTFSELAAQANKNGNFCGLCGKKVSGHSAIRKDLNIYVCGDCIKKAYSISTHETPTTCKHCGYKFLSGFAAWFYKSKDPVCPACNNKLSFTWDYNESKRILTNPNSAFNDRSSAIKHIKGEKIYNHKGDYKRLTEPQKIELLLIAMNINDNITHYSAYHYLKKMKYDTPQVKEAIKKYELKNNIKPPNPASTNTTKRAVTPRPLTPQKKTSPTTTTSSSSNTSPRRNEMLPEDQWMNALMSLPIDRTKSSYFKKNKDQVIEYIKTSLRQPSTRGRFLNLSKDGRYFAVLHTDSHYHDIYRTGQNEWSFITSRMG